MKTIILHEMIIDNEQNELRIGEIIEVDGSQIESIHSIRPWRINRYLPESERKKVAKISLGATGSSVLMLSGKTHIVVESSQYIRKKIGKT